ncbi:AAA family ATPase [Pararoseomonas sp. SCSIO 73927]|uniref:AAA family ATPase n=1 Tax=Pararoseomonas sp. SCSIO 73927 TaxID=3114537 RepID=UPI0030CE6933
MRLTGLTLRRYGPFEETALTFDPAPGRINLVLAPNGAGKSVLRQAFQDLLFGIGGQTPMGFRHGYPGMQIAATGIGPDGAPFAFTRRKGNRNTLTGEGDAPLDQTWLDRLLGRADGKLMSQLFALDTERLRQGGRELLTSGGILADALLAAAGGLREASSLHRALEGERDALAPPRKTASRPFYVALDRWSESRRQLKDSLVRPQEWAERERALRDAEARRDESNRAAAEAGSRLRRLERVRRTRPLLTAHAMATAWLAASPHAPRLPADLAGRLPAARGAVAQARHTLETARAYLARLDEDVARVAVDDVLLAVTEEIQALAGMVGLVESAMAGLPGTEEALAEARDRVAEQARILGRADATEAASLVPPSSLVAQLRRLKAEQEAQETALAGLPRRAAEQEARLAQAEQAMAALPPPEDMRQLEEMLGEIQREGDPTRNLAAARRGVEEAEAQFAGALARLPALLRDPETLAGLDPPTEAVLTRLAAARDAARLLLERHNEAIRRAEGSLAAVKAEKAALEVGGAPSTGADLLKARRHREAGWDLVFRRLSGEAIDREKEEAYGDGRSLPLAYAEAVSAADRIADARWSDAERVAGAERLVRALAEREAELSAALDEARGAREASDAAQAAWAAAIHPLGLHGRAGLAEVQRLIAAREAGLAARQALTTAQAALTEVRARQEGAATRLLRLLDDAAPGDLSVVLDRAASTVLRRRAAQDRRREYEAAATAAHDALRDIGGEREAAAESRLRCQAEWGAALERLGQAPDLPPQALDGILEASDILAGSLRSAAELEVQASAWRGALARFRTVYAAICERLGGTPGEDALGGLRELDRRQRIEAALAERRAALLGQRERELGTLRQHEAALAEAEAALRAVIAEAGAATVEVAEERILLGQERARQEGLRDAAAADLLTGGDGLDLNALRTEAAALAADDLEGALREAEEAQRGHAAAAQEQVAIVTTLEVELRQLAGDEAALRAAANEASAAGQIGQTLEDALVMQVAAGLLEAALGAVQDGGDDALLRRIGETFSELTNGTYSGVASREDDRGTARLVLRMRDFPEEEVEVDQLSEGTRDQLFLALRLVAIADEAASGTVLPFIGDDILQSHDDRRAAAAFRALLRLSETTQVILLTHHEHLLGVLRDPVSLSSIHVQHLGLPRDQ